MKVRALSAAWSIACTAAFACSSTHTPAPLTTPLDEGGSPSTSDGGAPADATAGDAELDAAGLLGSAANPAPSCKAILAARPGVPSGTYALLVATKAFETRCDMTTAGGGWTRVRGAGGATDPTSDAKIVEALRGSTGRLMLRCSETAPPDGGGGYITSPSFDSAWSWAAAAPTFRGGAWAVNGAPAQCDGVLTLPAGDCSTWWGISCASTNGNKVLAGVTASVSALSCTNSSSVNTGGAFDICGSSTYADYVVYVRAD